MSRNNDNGDDDDKKDDPPKQSAGYGLAKDSASYAARYGGGKAAAFASLQHSVSTGAITKEESWAIAASLGLKA